MKSEQIQSNLLYINHLQEKKQADLAWLMAMDDISFVRSIY